MANRITKIILRGDVSDLQAKLTVAGKALGDTANKVTAAGKESEKFRQGLTTLGGTAGKVGLVAAAGLGLAVAAAARFDASMSKVQAATHESAGNMELLRGAAIKAGADTVFSATEAADAITALAKAGVSTKDVLAGGLQGALSLASAGELDVASAAEIAATAMTQFGLSGKDIPHIADLLAAAAGKAQGEVSDMANSLKYVGPVAHQMGISIEETTGVIAELASQGILGEQAGTSLRGMLTSLTSPSQIASQTMKNLGISLYDASGNFVGLRGVAGQLSDTMGKLSNAERDQALGRIFGNEQITAARILYAGGVDAVDKWTKAVDDNGYAAETAAIKMDNLQGDLEQLRGSFETALIGLGEGDQGPLRSLVQHLTDAVNAFNDLPGPAKNATTALLGITAVTGGALWFGSKVIRGIADTRAALTNLGPTAVTTAGRLGKIGATGAGILVAAQAIGALVNATTDLGNATSSSDVPRDLDKIANGVTTDSLGKLTGALEGINEAGASAVHAIFAIPSALTGIKTSFDTNKDTIKAFDEQLASMVESGHAEEAAAAFQTIRDAAAKHGGVSDNDVVKQFERYTDAAAGATGAAKLMSDAMTGLIAPTDGVTAVTGPMGAAVQQSTADLAAQAKALEESRKAANDTARQFANLGSKVNDSKVSLNDWVKDLEKQAAALRDFTKNARTAGKKGVEEGLIASLEKLGPEGALRMKQLADASEKEIRRANRAWRSQEKAVDAYTNAVGGVPPAATTTLELHAAAAEAALARIMREINQIPKSWRTDYYVVQHNAISKPRVQNQPGVGNADGGTIPHAAAGWTVAGQRHPYGDKVLAYLAPGEEVITNRHGEADQFRADRAAGRIPAYANGMAFSQPVAAPVGSSSSGGQDRLLGFRDARDAHLAALRTALKEVPIMQVPNDPSLLYGVS